jgi:PAS domain S-box-containing protein
MPVLNASLRVGRAMSTPSWFSAEDELALRDLCAIYAAQLDDLPNGPARELLVGAVAGDWAPYEAHLRLQAASFARQGLSLEAWHQPFFAASRALLPSLVAAYAGEPRRLTAALLAQQQHDERALTVLVEAYGDAHVAICAEAAALSHPADTTMEHPKEMGVGDALVRTLVDAVADYAMFVLDPSGVVVTWNRGAETLKGYEPGEILGKNVAVFYTPEDQAAGTPAHELRLAARDGRSEGEGWRVRRDGTRFWANVVICAMKDAAGTVLGFAKITRDLTSRRAAERALSEATRELEGFSYSVAHDLRAPLRGMSGFARLLLDNYGGSLDAEGNDWLQEILLNASKMAELIDALLSLGRVTRTELRVERVDLSAMASSIAARLLAAEPARVVQFAISPKLSADMDPSLAKALLENLLQNAWKFTGRTPAALIEVGAMAGSGTSEFFVRDNGAGFDMAFADKLFKPFQRLHSAREFPGTGIGLATARRIVHCHGGRISAEGCVDHGVTVRFTVPSHSTGAAA